MPLNWNFPANDQSKKQGSRSALLNSELLTFFGKVALSKGFLCFSSQSYAGLIAVHKLYSGRFQSTSKSGYGRGVSDEHATHCFEPFYRR